MSKAKAMNPSVTKIGRGVGRIVVVLMLMLASATGCTTVSCDWASTSPDQYAPGADSESADDGKDG